METFIDVTPANLSPTSSISTISDLTPTELGEEIERVEKQTVIHHGPLYPEVEGGIVDIVCGYTIYRLPSRKISSSSSELRAILFQPELLGTPSPEGIPRILVSDSEEDFAMLLKMIFRPGSVSHPPFINHVD